MTFCCAKHAIFRNMEHECTDNLHGYLRYCTMHMEFN